MCSALLASGPSLNTRPCLLSNMVAGRFPATASSLTQASRSVYEGLQHSLLLLCALCPELPPEQPLGQSHPQPDVLEAIQNQLNAVLSDLLGQASSSAPAALLIARMLWASVHASQRLQQLLHLQPDSKLIERLQRLLAHLQTWQQS